MRLGLRDGEHHENLIDIGREHALAVPSPGLTARQHIPAGSDRRDAPPLPALFRLDCYVIANRELDLEALLLLESPGERRTHLRAIARANLPHASGALNDDTLMTVHAPSSSSSSGHATGGLASASSTLSNSCARVSGQAPSRARASWSVLAHSR